MQISKEYLNALTIKFYTFLLYKFANFWHIICFSINNRRKVINSQIWSIFWPTLYKNNMQIRKMTVWQILRISMRSEIYEYNGAVIGLFAISSLFFARLTWRNDDGEKLTRLTYTYFHRLRKIAGETWNFMYMRMWEPTAKDLQRNTQCCRLAFGVWYADLATRSRSELLAAGRCSMLYSLVRDLWR